MCNIFMWSKPSKILVVTLFPQLPTAFCKNQEVFKQCCLILYLCANVSKSGAGLAEQPSTCPKASGSAGLRCAKQPARLRCCCVPKQTLQHRRGEV